MNLYNDDELVSPPWINEEFLEKVLTLYEKIDNIKILKIDIKPASMRGDHYASIMFRCKVDYGFDSVAIKRKSLIIKTLPIEDGAKRELLIESRLFETEIEMYTKTLPEIEKILAECGEPTKMCAEIIYHALEPQKVIVFEDLCEAGYDIVRGRNLTKDEIKAVYRKIAKLHAVSYMLGLSENHEVVTGYQEGIFCNSTIMTMDMMANGIVEFMKMLSSNEEFAVYLEKIKTLRPDITEKCKALYNAYKMDKGKTNIHVLNHGDFHLKNLMFKFNNDTELEDLIMIDFQISCFGPSNIDMMYSQYMMLSPDLRLKKNELSQYYFTEFISILKKINFEGEMPKYSNFQIADIKYRHFAVFLMTTFLPFVRKVLAASLDELKEVDMAKLMETSNATAAIYEHPDFIDDMRRYLPYLLAEGYLD